MSLSYIIHTFLQHSHKNTAKRRKLVLRTKQMFMRDQQLEGSFQLVSLYLKYGEYFYNCLHKPEV